MLSADLLKRLEALNRDRVPVAIPRPHLPFPSAPLAAAPRELTPSRHRASAAPADLTLRSLAPGEVIANAHGAHYLVRANLADIWPAARGRPWQVIGEASAGDDDTRHADIKALVAALRAGVVFLDLETCGFAGSPIFLVGIVSHRGDDLTLEQFLARDYTEEPAMLASLALRMRDCRTLVTFNGKSFDWPMVLERAAYHRLARQSSDDATDLRAFTSEYRLVHCDLLHHARRRWRGRLPNCRLQTLERFVCRRHRVDDIAGGRIPQEYHHFVRTRDARRMAEVLEHNALDLVTLVELAIRLARPNGGVPTAT